MPVTIHGGTGYQLVHTQPLRTTGAFTAQFVQSPEASLLPPAEGGVLGLLAAAEGRPREADVSDLAALRFGVRLDQPGRLQRDFQTAIRREGSRTKAMPLSHRFYLADAVFLAAVEGRTEIIHALADALRRPVYPLFLGRRGFPIEGRLLWGVRDRELEGALRAEEWLASARHRSQQGKVVFLPIVMDATEGDEVADTVRDVPVSYSSERREYVWRDVVRPHPVRVDNPDGHDRPDFFAALGGA